MLLLIPHLFPSARLLETAAQDLRLPALETLLARGTRQDMCTTEGVEAAVRGPGIARQQDWPLAPITLQANGGQPGTDYWLRADPVHFSVMRDRIVLAGSHDLELCQAEADELAASIAAHFGADLSPQPLHPQRWYLRLSTTPELATTPLSRAMGCDIDPLLPRGHDASRFRSQLNELQMLLHDHPVNQTREIRGQLPINSLWLWGGGTLPQVRPHALRIATDNADAIALIQFAGATRIPADAHANQGNPDIVVLETLVAAGQVGDAFGWREGVRAVDEQLQAWLQGGRTFILADPVRGLAYAWCKADRYKFWRRRVGFKDALR
jgi:hypothetical protein